ncbi:DUF1801 domain-containing protein [Chitinophaga lutea]|uniref:DUF1801 domain-containing protein n=1 Tax=Chitinophaga lutea TaxID=2488634 RepID=A0A3N4PJQ4_9BACT|nr:DUF1801 domain-containing protein [Chitinophaga lutea]RPE08045.1 DUF1801 domain-containing protein [Chitinophaga lutea]
MANRSPEVDDFIARQAPAFRSTLEEMRTIIRSAAPDAEELISYQVPSFKHHYMLVGFGANSKYCSLFTMSPALVRELEPSLKDVKISGATLHFPPGKKLPAALIKKIVKLRMKQNEAKALAKK